MSEVQLDGRIMMTVVWEVREYRDEALVREARAASPEAALRAAGLPVAEGLDEAVDGLLDAGVLDTSQVALPPRVAVNVYEGGNVQAFWRVPGDGGMVHVAKGDTLAEAVRRAAKAERARQREGLLLAAERAMSDARRWVEKADALAEDG